MGSGSLLKARTTPHQESAGPPRSYGVLGVALGGPLMDTEASSPPHLPDLDPQCGPHAPKLMGVGLEGSCLGCRAGGGGGEEREGREMLISTNWQR